MSNDLAGDALEGPAPPSPDLDSDRDTLHLALRWLLEQDSIELPDGEEVTGQEVFDQWMDVIEKRRRKQNNMPYGGEFVSERFSAQLRSLGYTGPKVSYAAIKRWWRRKAL